MFSSRVFKITKGKVNIDDKTNSFEFLMTTSFSDVVKLLERGVH